MAYYEDDPEHIPISINNAENGLLLCRNCHGYFDNKPQRLIHIKSNGTIELTGKAKEQRYGPGGACLHGKKVPWADKINKKDWRTLALLHVVYHLKAKSRKRKGTDLDLGIVDAADLPASSPIQGKAAAPKKSKAAAPKKSKASRKKSNIV